MFPNCGLHETDRLPRVPATMLSPLCGLYPQTVSQNKTFSLLSVSSVRHFITVVRKVTNPRALPTALPRLCHFQAPLPCPLSGKLNQHSHFSMEAAIRDSGLHDTSRVRTNHSALYLPGFNATATTTFLLTTRDSP